MKIKVNGEEKYLETNKSQLSLTQTLNSLGYRPNTIVVELNNFIVNYEGWETEKVVDGDVLEIVSIVGGG